MEKSTCIQISAMFLMDALTKEKRSTATGNQMRDLILQQWDRALQRSDLAELREIGLGKLEAGDVACADWICADGNLYESGCRLLSLLTDGTPCTGTISIPEVLREMEPMGGPRAVDLKTLPAVGAMQ